LEVISALAGLWNIQNVNLRLIIEAKPSSGFDVQVSSLDNWKTIIVHVLLIHLAVISSTKLMSNNGSILAFGPLGESHELTEFTRVKLANVPEGLRIVLNNNQTMAIPRIQHVASSFILPNLKRHSSIGLVQVCKVSVAPL
jgi:hypothetical protein